MTKIEQARQYLGANRASKSFLALFMPMFQRALLWQQLQGEEAEGIAEATVNTVERIKACPITYEQDGLGMKAKAHLHYFRGSVDVYVTELDSIDTVSQAFGWVDLGFGGELGYIHLPEVTAAGIELDLYFEPKSLEEAVKQ